MERLSKRQKNLPSTEYKCKYPKHPGKIPKVWEVRYKCIPENCPYLMTKIAFDLWCKENNVYFIGG